MSIKGLTIPVKVLVEFRQQAQLQDFFSQILKNNPTDFNQNAFLPDDHRHCPAGLSYGSTKPGRQLC